MVVSEQHLYQTIVQYGKTIVLPRNAYNLLKVSQYCAISGSVCLIFPLILLPRSSEVFLNQVLLKYDITPPTFTSTDWQNNVILAR